MARNTNRAARSRKPYQILCIPGREAEDPGTWFVVHRDSGRAAAPVCGIDRAGRLAAIELAARLNG